MVELKSICIHSNKAVLNDHELNVLSEVMLFHKREFSYSKMICTSIPKSESLLPIFFEDYLNSVNCAKRFRLRPSA